jgi:hypothetical protein
LSKKLETKGTLLDEHTGGRPKMNAGFDSEWDTLYYFITIETSIPNDHDTTHYKAVCVTARKLYVNAQRITLAGYSAYLVLLAFIYT